MKENLKFTGSADKGSTLQERTYYQCFCMKNYQSYSALYLHVKNKHNTNLSFKAFRSRKTNWSGSIKNIIMQFEEQSKDKKVEPLRLSLRQRPRKMCLKQIESQEEEPQSKGRKVDKKIKSQQVMQIYEGKNIINVFQLYEKISETKQLQEFRKQLLTRLTAFADRHYLNYMQGTTKIFRSSYCLESSCQEIPLMLNQFFKQECQQGLHNQAQAIQLIRLSEWLYYNGFTSKLFENDGCLKNLCKVEATNHIQTVKIQND